MLIVNCELDENEYMGVCQFLASAQQFLTAIFDVFLLLFAIVFSFFSVELDSIKISLKTTLAHFYAFVVWQRREKNVRKMYAPFWNVAWTHPNINAKLDSNFSFNSRRFFVLVIFFLRMFALVSHWFSLQSIWINIVILFSQSHLPWQHWK